MTCEVKIIDDSINPYNGIRLTTMQLRYWRGIHAEFMTHRVFSRNASSSRAIPISTFLKQVWNDPARPIHWGANNSGMQSKRELNGWKRSFAKFSWDTAGKIMCIIVYLVNTIVKPHKQTFNRLLEPWQYISVIVTSSEWDNFFELRDHPAAQPEIGELAQAMKLAMEQSVPVKKRYHLPYVSDEEIVEYNLEQCYKLSTARCARVSYLTHDGKKPNFERDIKLHDDLVGSVPIHASPSEHSAVAVVSPKFKKNFRGWKQYRETVEQNIIKG
jgi:hypothetical protein